MAQFRLSSTVLTGGVAIGCAFGAVALQHNQLGALNQPSSQLLRQEEDLERVRIQLLETTPTLGFDNLIADWSFLGFIQYFGDINAREVTGYTLIPEFYEVVVKRDPRFVQAYQPLTFTTSMFAGRPDRTIALLDQGLMSITPDTHPNAYMVWFYRGVEGVLSTNDLKTARQAYGIAAAWASQQKDPFSQAIAERAQSGVAFLDTKPDTLSARISTWVTVLSLATDQQTRQRALEKIVELGGIVEQTPTSVRVLIPKQPKTQN